MNSMTVCRRFVVGSYILIKSVKWNSVDVLYVHLSAAPRLFWSLAALSTSLTISHHASRTWCIDEDDSLHSCLEHVKVRVWPSRKCTVAILISFLRRSSAFVPMAPYLYLSLVSGVTERFGGNPLAISSMSCHRFSQDNRDIIYLKWRIKSEKETFLD